MIGVAIALILYRLPLRGSVIIDKWTMCIAAPALGAWKALIKRRRLKRFDAAFPDAITGISSALHAGCGLLQAIEEGTKGMNGPVAIEFRQMLSEVRLGAGMSDALDGMCVRVASGDLLLVVQTVDVLKETGGDIIKAFEAIVSTIHGRNKVEKRIRTIASEGMAQAYTLLAMPFCLGAALYAISPEYLRPLIGTRAGVVMIAAGLLLQAAGFLWMRRIARIVV